jgi:hypothetical protein
MKGITPRRRLQKDSRIYVLSKLIKGYQPCTTHRESGIDFPLYRSGLLGFEVFLGHGFVSPQLMNLN